MTRLNGTFCSHSFTRFFLSLLIKRDDDDDDDVMKEKFDKNFQCDKAQHGVSLLNDMDYDSLTFFLCFIFFFVLLFGSCQRLQVTI